MPRMLMFGPAPGLPLSAVIETPAARALSTLPMSGAADSSRLWGTLISATELPISRRAWPPAVPLTTSVLSSTGTSLSARRMSVAPTVTVRVSAANPRRCTVSVTCGPGPVGIRKRPLMSVTPPAPESTRICAPAIGVRSDARTTVPDTLACDCAPAGTVAVVQAPMSNPTPSTASNSVRGISPPKLYTRCIPQGSDITA
jgi:hypothetical protein